MMNQRPQKVESTIYEDFIRLPRYALDRRLEDISVKLRELGNGVQHGGRHAARHTTRVLCSASEI